MIRFILKRSILDKYTKCRIEDYITIDNDLVELEKLLHNSGIGEDHYQCYSVVGCEVKS